MAPAWPGGGRANSLAAADGDWVAWRLVAGNHRELARSAAVYPTAGEASVASARLRGDVDAATATTVMTAGLWDWQLSVDGQVLAVAGRLYQRPRECRYSLMVTIRAIRAADVVRSLQCLSGGEPG